MREYVDKVFSLWHIAPACFQQNVPANYGSTLYEVLSKVVAHNEIVRVVATARHFKRDTGFLHYF